MLLEKNINLPEEIQEDLSEMKNNFGATLKDAIDITTYFVKKLKIKKRVENGLKKEEKKDINGIVIDDKDIEEEEEEWDCDRDM